MFFFNLSAVEFISILGAVSSFVVVLYLLDRSRKRHVVPTLRFWQNSEIPSQRKHRRRIQQPWSLILQLLGIALLLLAIAQIKLGSPDRSSRDHVVLVDASAWMQARGANRQMLLDESRAAALRYIRALPSSDRVMIVRADALATPLTGFESNRTILTEALQSLQPGTAALNLAQAFDFARQAMRLEGKRTGEIVFAGAGRMTLDTAGETVAPPPGFRLLRVAAEPENAGLRKLSVRRALNDPELWEIFVTVRNYGRSPKAMPLVVTYGGAPVGTRRISLPPGGEVAANFEFRTKAAGWLEARIDPRDALPADDTASIELPAQRTYRVVVYSPEPDLLKPILQANRSVQTVFRRPNEYRAEPEANILIFDRCQPPAPVDRHVIWIDPPPNASPFPLRARKQNAALRWQTTEVLAAGLRSKDATIDSTAVFGPASGDLTIAEVDGGPVILARSGKSKSAAFGFHPMRTALRYELATPLVFANILRWMAPEVFLRTELHAGSTGTVSVPLGNAHEDLSAVRVIAGEQAQLPFTIRDQTLRFFSPNQGVVRVSLGDRAILYSLSLPDIGETRWEAPKNVRTGFAGVGGAQAAARDIWYWLALLGAALLAAEWILFARSKAQGAPAGFHPIPVAEAAQRKAS